MFNFLGAEYSKNSKACFNPYTLANFMLKREILYYPSAFGSIERLKSLGLTQNEMDKILWKNSAHFFKI